MNIRRQYSKQFNSRVHQEATQFTNFEHSQTMIPQISGSVDSTPWLNEVLPMIHERTNLHDRYAIAARKSVSGCIVESAVGHLPKEIPRVTWFIILKIEELPGFMLIMNLG